MHTYFGLLLKDLPFIVSYTVQQTEMLEKDKKMNVMNLGAKDTNHANKANTNNLTSTKPQEQARSFYFFYSGGWVNPNIALVNGSPLTTNSLKIYQKSKHKKSFGIKLNVTPLSKILVSQSLAINTIIQESLDGNPITKK